LQGGLNEAKEKYDATELISKVQGAVNILIDYVSRIESLSSLISDYDCREPGTTSTSKGNCYPRISPRQHRQQVLMSPKLKYASKMATITATFL